MTYTDIKLQAKLNYLRRLLNIRVRLMKYIEAVTIEVEGDMVHVTWHSKPGLKKKISCKVYCLLLETKTLKR